MLAGWQIEPLDGRAAPEETGATYYENALHQGALRARARAGRRLGARRGLRDRVRRARRRPGAALGPLGAGRDQADALLERLAGEPERAGAHGQRARRPRARRARSSTASGVLEGEIAAGRRGRERLRLRPDLRPRRRRRSTVAEIGDAWKRAQLPPRPAALALAAVESARGR